MLEWFEQLVRRAHRFSEERVRDVGGLHPFDERSIHPKLPSGIRVLFDDGHYSQATFEAFKFIDNEVRRHSGVQKTGFPLMMNAFGGTSPPVQLTRLSGQTEMDEQKGFQFIFAGSILAIRNPRGHEVLMHERLDECLDHLAFASLLLRRLEESGFEVA